MSEPETLTIEVNGFPTRIWRKGGWPENRLPRRLRWAAALDSLPGRTGEIAHRHRAVAAGPPRGDRGHIALDTHLDWLLAIRGYP